MARRFAKTSKPYDVTFKHLVEDRPRDALAFVGITDIERVEILDTDVSAITATVDKAIKATTRQGKMLVHLEFQSGYDAELVERAFWYNAALYHRHRLPVQTVLVLLTKAADNPRITGTMEVRLPSGETSLSFRYRVVRLWQIPVGNVLASGLGVLPLAPLADHAGRDIAEVIGAMQQRMENSASPAEQDLLWAAAYLLMGLKFDPLVARRLILGGKHMRESSTYQAILEEGRVEGRVEGRGEGALREARKLLLEIGGDLLGRPSNTVKKSIQSFADLAQLEQMLVRVHKVDCWEKLLNVAPAGKNGQKKKT